MSIDVDWCRFDCHKNTTGLFKNWRHYLFTTFMLGMLNMSIIGFICDMCENTHIYNMNNYRNIFEIQKSIYGKTSLFFDTISLRFPHLSKKSLDFLFKYYFLKALPALLLLLVKDCNIASCMSESSTSIIIWQYSLYLLAASLNASSYWLLDGCANAVVVTAENGSSAVKLQLPVSFLLNCFVAGLLSCCSLTLYFFFRDGRACVKNVGDSMTSSARECG